MDKQQQLTAIYDFTASKLGNDQTGHDMAHIKRVVKMAKQLNQDNLGDPFIIEAAALLHDVIDEKLFTDITAAKASVKDFLTQIAVPAKTQTAIFDIISNMSFAHSLENRPTLSLEGQIVQDADWLDAIGAIGIARAIYYGAKHHEKLYDPAILPRENLTKEQYRNLADETIINHFYEKLFKIKDLLNTAAAKEIATQRQALMRSFVTAVKEEWV
ncbi:HD domain-containing protein [Ligilactobacillus apodemi]|uniref:HD superfamily hydrolase n=1 Tax=Ligilactobacillus apodemi DSM 16634 = JCM 16172 TaxID=1423724 RepID=A0A0R1TYL4_9LACO|nr:HD domain-containing protein [Ligilactobacillus apodemi]KRL86205.1 HD superfamily hydrolase [Ligilactobacillus apodemi DSM 16634 = JCM 16172]MBD5069602.1 HD domain-containing protein [Lactobacillus sp.]